MASVCPYLILSLFVRDGLVVADPGEGDHAVQRGPAVGEERVQETVQRLAHQERSRVHQVTHLRGERWRRFSQSVRRSTAAVWGPSVAIAR